MAEVFRGWNEGELESFLIEITAEILVALRDALYAAKICSYAQGFALLKAAGRVYGWEMDVGRAALVWRSGCIIRAGFLDRIAEAYGKSPGLVNLMLDPFFSERLNRAQTGWRWLVATAKELGIATPALSSSLDYFDGYRSADNCQKAIRHDIIMIGYG